jgi:hypothetical protein
MNEYSLSDIAAAADGANRNGGFGDGGWCMWLMFLFFLCYGNNGWGNNGNNAAANGSALYPWLNQAQMTSQGFADQNAVMALNGISGAVAQGFGDMSTQLCGGFAGVQQSMANGFAGVEAGANARQVAAMQQGFAQQTAMQQGMNGLGMSMQQGFNGVQQGFNDANMTYMQGFNGMQAQLANCCCENRLATANQTATILAEHCSDRAALSDGIRDIIAANNAGTQRILDRLCEQELYAERRENENLRQQVNMMNLAASQQAQTAQILADNFAQTSALEQYLAPVPRPCYVVQNPNCCGGQYANCGYAA